MDEKLLQLPWQIQVALGIGYLSYSISYTGIRKHHQQVHAFFISICFSAIALVILRMFSVNQTIKASFFALAGTVLSALIWRAIGIEIYRMVLRGTDISWSDDTLSAWASITSSKILITQIAVLHEDGTWLRCDDASKFSGLPFGPCQLGPEGDVALYLTHEELTDQPPKTLTSTVDVNYGARLTYIPATKLKRVTIRFKPEPNRLSRAAAVATGWLYRSALWARLFPTVSSAGQ